MPDEQSPNSDTQTPAEARILAAAKDEFASNGFYGARMQAIADAAGVNKAMLHYYFRSKENLYGLAILSALRNIITQVWGVWTLDGPIHSRVENVIDIFVDNYAHNPGLLKMILREVVEGGDRFRKAFGEIRDRYPFMPDFSPKEMRARIASELGIPSDEIAHFMVNLIGMCLMSFISPLLLETVADYEIQDFDKYLDQRRAAIKAMVLAYIKARIVDSDKE